MPIKYMQNENLFHIAAGDVSYIIHIYRGCYPMHVYYGRRVPDEDVRWYIESPYRRKKMIDAQEPDDPMFLREFFPFEYPTYGTSDFRAPALDLRDTTGSCVSDLRYAGYEILPGKPQLKDIPSLYCESDDEATTLLINLKDAVSGLEASLFYTVYESNGLITRHAEITNGGQSKVTLKSALSLSVDFKHAPYEMLQLSGTALREHHIVRRRLECGEMSIDSTRGISSHQQNPFIALVQRDTTETQGDAYGFSLIYSGNFIARIECDMYMSARVQLGINPFMFSWQLNPGDTFETPEAVMAFSHEGLNGMSQKLHSAMRTRLYRGVWRDRERPVLLNTWEAAYFKFDHDKIMDMARKAAQVGVELLVLDDGWFGHRDDSRSSLGDWYVNAPKLPRGLDGLASDINALGMKFGLWFEPEMVSPDSDLYRAHPDWCIHVDGRKRSEWRNQLVLDLTRPEVRDYIVDSVCAVLESANIEYVKWDCNRRITEPGTPSLPADRQDELMHRYVLGLYDVMKRITSRFPNILFENCASGGARMDPGMMAFFPQTWPSDDSDAEERLKIQYGTSLCYPPVMTTSHVSICPNEQIKRTEPLSFRGNVAFPFNLGYELNLCRLSDEELGEVAQQIAVYKSLRKLVQHGTFYRLSDPFQGPYAAWMTVVEDGSEFVAWFYKPSAAPEEAYINVRLSGLEPNAHYRNLSNGHVISGAVLMNMGLAIDWENGDDFSQMWHFVRV